MYVVRYILRLIVVTCMCKRKSYWRCCFGIWCFSVLSYLSDTQTKLKFLWNFYTRVTLLTWLLRVFAKKRSYWLFWFAKLQFLKELLITVFWYKLSDASTYAHQIFAVVKSFQHALKVIWICMSVSRFMLDYSSSISCMHTLVKQHTMDAEEEWPQNGLYWRSFFFYWRRWILTNLQ